MARWLLLPLILLVALVGLLAYVGSERVIQFELLASAPTGGQFISVQAAIVICAGIVLGIILLWSLLTWMWRLPNRMKKGMGRRRSEIGLDAVEQALLAVESGDGAGALKKAKKASELLNRPALTALISAKAAEMRGAHDDAHSHYTSLKDNPDTEAAGLRGLARLSETRGDHAASIEMATAAFAGSKSPSWAFDLLYNSQTALADWEGALDTLATAEKRKLLDKDEIRRRRAVLLAANANALDAKGRAVEALDQAKRAADLSPGFAPGVALAARLLSKDGQIKKAAQIIEKAWGRSPHPALSIAYRDVWQGETAKTVAKKINQLIKSNSGHRESKILAAEQAIAADDGVTALSALDGLLRDEDPSARLCALAAQAEKMLGNTVDAHTWQNRAVSAPIEADWSDLDPDGAAFNYTDADWQRLALSYGKSGTLIHPRYEAYKRRRAVGSVKEAVQSIDTPPNADDPGIDAKGTEKQDLADRLQNLLEGDPKA
ncbi:MAG: hypothetical protein L3J65_04130 [Robiginitomaculum sp.]|nr:hypothetical protein [Robiginitomaculum sp.]